MMDPFEQFFSRYPTEVQAICGKLRAMVNRAMPEASEVLVARQNHIGYDCGASSRDRVVYICPLKDYVRLGFMYGTRLADPEKLLVGEGKRLRHIKIRSINEAGNPALKPLVKEAWADAKARRQASASKTAQRK